MRKRGSFVLTLLVISSLTGSHRTPAAGQPGPFVEDGLLASTRALDVAARFEESVPAGISSVPGVTVKHRFESVPAVWLHASPAALHTLAALDGLVSLEADKPIEFDLDTATEASRAKDVFDPAFDPATPPVTAPDGGPIDGSGIGIAIVDTGLDALHPDFAGAKVGGNWFVTPGAMVPAPLTSAGTTQNGHGTHVAGIAAGTGAASAGTSKWYRGAAPGATLFAFSMYYGTTIHAAAAFDWILAHNHELTPRIRVVNNSWHCSAVSCGHQAPDRHIHMALASQLAESGVVVTWAAGNDMGEGWLPTTSREATNRTPGIIGVANYKDDDIGHREGCLSSSSAWGASADPTTWPDLAAPGRSITAAWPIAAHYSGGTQVNSRNPVDGMNTYRVQTGTSMAAPHVAGIVALLLEANPALTPAEVEYILKQTATPLVGASVPGNEGCGIDYIKADPAHPWHAANYAAGHGLVHTYDAVKLAQQFPGVPPAVAPEPIPEDFVVVRPGIEVDRTLYFSGDDDLVETFPDAPAPRAAPMEPNSSRIFLSEPLGTTQVVDAVKVDVYIGTTAEAVAVLTAPRVRVSVEAVRPDGSRELVASDQVKLWQIHPGAPTQRDIAIELRDPEGGEPRPFTFAAEDRVRVSVGVYSPPIAGVDPPPIAWALYWERPTTSRVSLGHVDDRPAAGSRAACEARQDCAMLDSEHLLESLTCGNVPVRLAWTGPGGSSIAFSCAGTTFTCPIVTGPNEPWGHCEREFEFPQAYTNKGGYCFAVTANGQRQGHGTCVASKVVEDDD